MTVIPIKIKLHSNLKSHLFSEVEKKTINDTAKHTAPSFLDLLQIIQCNLIRSFICLLFYCDTCRLTAMFLSKWNINGLWINTVGDGFKASLSQLSFQFILKYTMKTNIVKNYVSFEINADIIPTHVKKSKLKILFTQYTLKALFESLFYQLNYAGFNYS